MGFFNKATHKQTLLFNSDDTQTIHHKADCYFTKE